MWKKPLFYVLVFGLALLLSLYTRLNMAATAADFYLFADAPFWTFLRALLVIFLLDRLHRRAGQRGAASGQARYFFGLLWRGALPFVALQQLLTLALELTHLGHDNYASWYAVLRGLAFDVFLYLMVGSIYLPFLYQQHAAARQLELEQLAREASRTRLQALQQHVDPHFLFNNLNILSALIEPGNAAALAYVEHLARLYRYLVRTREQELVPVADELAFARDYQFLLRQRFGAAYAFAEDLAGAPPAALAGGLLPPGVLQELLGNAVKHNLASRRQPLRVELHLTPTHLTLRNARQPRPAPAEGEGSGLASLRARFALLTDEPVCISATATEFAVRLPLLRALPVSPPPHERSAD